MAVGHFDFLVDDSGCPDLKGHSHGFLIYHVSRVMVPSSTRGTVWNVPFQFSGMFRFRNMFPCMNHDLRELGPVPLIGLILEPSGLRMLLGSAVTRSR